MRIMAFSLFASLFLFSSIAHAAVVVYDSVTTTKRVVKLTALTKGRFFPDGGRLVDFYINGSHIGRTLSGGDGYAYLEYIPRRAGLKEVEVRSGDDRDHGALLVVGKNGKVVIIEVESGLRKTLFSEEPRAGSVEAVKGLLDRFRVVYLTSMLGLKASRQWIEDKGLPASAVLKWRGTELLDELREAGIRVYAIIGSPAVLSEASEHIKRRFSFDETGDGEEVKDWKELSKRLK